MNNLYFLRKAITGLMNVKVVKPVLLIKTALLLMFISTGINAAVGQTTELFRQDFSSSTTVSSYVNSTSPDNGQFTLISAYLGSDITRTIENGAFVFAKTNTSTAYGVASRTVDFAGPPQTMAYSFDITVSGVDSGSTGGLTIGVGNGFPTTTSNPSTGAYYVRTSISLTTTGFSISGQPFSGTQRVTYFLNNSGAAANYNAPDGSIQSLANDKYDIWVGSTRVAAAASATTATQSMAELHTKFAPSLRGKVALDNFLITTFADAAPDTQAPTAPSNLQASASTNSASLSWDASTDNVGVTGYKIYKNDVFLAQVSGTSYTATGLDPSTAYSFSVSAVDAAANESAKSAVSVTTAAPDSEAPTAPSNLQASAAETTVSLSWNASTDNTGVTGYKVYNGETLITTVETTSYTVSGLTPSSAYTFHVTAVDAANNESARSSVNTTTAEGDTQAPSAPSNVQATPASTSVQLNWTASTDNRGVGKYKIYRGGVEVGETTSTSFTVYGLSASTSYTFGVSALDTTGNESAQSTITASTLSSSAASRGIDPFYGMHLGTDTDVKKAVSGLSDIGVYWTRIWLDIKTWNDPTKDNHSGTISRAIALKKAGFNVCLNLNANAGVVPASYEEAKAYFEYLWNVPGLKEAVDMWEIHNELNLYEDYWKGTAEEYVTRSLKAGWDVFHVAGGEQVLGGSFTLGQDTFGGTQVTQRYVEAGYLNYCDFAGTHPYATSLSELKTHFGKIKALYGDKPIFISEWNYKWSSTLNSNHANWSSLVKQAFDYFKAQDVKAVCYYRLLDGGDKQYWPGVISSGTYSPIQPFYNMYKSQPKSPDPSIASPLVSITLPAAADTIVAGGNVRVEASASDSDGSVAKVAFFYNGDKLIGEDTDGSDGWGVNWNNIPAGRYVLSVLATDSQGATNGDYGQSVYSKANTTGKVISINFKGTGSSLDTADVAGIVPRKYWNNGVNSATVSDLLDENAENTGASVSNTLPGNYRSADSGTNGDHKVMNGYIAAFNGDTKEVNVSSLPSVIADGSYDVYVYWGNQDSENDYAQYTISGKSYFIRDNTNRWNGVHTLSNAQSASAAASGANFVVFKNLTGSSFKIAVKAFGTWRAGVSGIQIVSSDMSPQLGTVTLTSPESGVAYKDKDTVTVSAATAGFGQEVKNVAFYSGSELMGIDSVATDGWELKINGVQPGQYSYTAIATDANGHAVISAPANIVVLGEAGDVISVNFTGSGPSLAANEPAGKVLVTNWNNTNYNTTTPLVDASGSVTGASVSNNLPAAYRSFDSESNGDFKMMKGYIANFSAGTKDVTVSNLPASYAEEGYNVYVYWGNKDNEDDAVEYKLNGTSYFLRDKTATWDGTHDLSTAKTRAEAKLGPNYVLFEGVTGSSFTLKVSAYNTYRAGISGMQIVRSTIANAKITSPAAGSVFEEGASVMLATELKNFADSVPAKEVSFYHNGDQLIGTDRDSTNGWTFEWKDVTPGSYTITAVAKSDSTTAISRPVNIRVSADASRVISVNFIGTATAVSAQDAIGAVPTANWNNSGANATTDSLVNGKGELTNTVISNNLPASYRSFDATPNGDFKMMKGYIANFSGDPKQVIIKNIPKTFSGSGYSLFVYWGNKDTENDYVSYNVDTTTFYIRDNNESWDGTHDVSKARTANEAKTGPNYVVFENLSTDSLVLNVTSFATFRGGISGLQLVANKPKGTAMLTNPVEGSEFSQCDSVAMTAELAGFGAAVKQVEFYTGTTLIGVDSVESDNWSFAWNKPSVGTHQLSVRAIDVNGYEAVSSTVTVTVLADTIAPVIIAPESLTVNNDQDVCSATVNAGTATATDNCGGVTVSGVRVDGLALDAAYPVGVTSITWTATDEAGNSSQAVQTITVNDVQAPVITVNPVPATIWPPNNKLVSYSIADIVEAVNDNCAGSIAKENVSIVAVSSDESDRRTQYIIADDKKSVQVLASRDGSGDGRTYTVEVEVADNHGNIGKNTYQILVPHDMRNGANTMSINTVDNNLLSETAAGLRAYPNPSNGNFTLQFYSAEPGAGELIISNSNGTVNYREKIKVETGTNSLRYSLNNLPDGVYVVRVSVGSTVLTTKLLITNQ